jgi:hypothetical protein
VAQEGAWVLTKRETQPPGTETTSSGWNHRHKGDFGSHQLTSSFSGFLMTTQFTWTQPPKFIAPGTKLTVKWDGKRLACQKGRPFAVGHYIVGGVEILDRNGKPAGSLAIWDDKKGQSSFTKSR